VARLFKFATIVVFLYAAVVACFAQTGIKSRIARDIDGNQMTRLQGNLHPLLQTATDLGRVNGAMRMKNVSLIFNPSASQKADLQMLLAQQLDPASPNYHKWLTPEEFGARFGMSASDLLKITAWLKSQGFTVNEVSRGRNRVSFSGSAAQISSAFHSEFHQYMVNGEKHIANATEFSVPSAFADTVLGFKNVNDFVLKPRARKVSSKFTSSISGNTFLAPEDLATIYDINPLYNAGINGAGQTIVVVGQTAIKLSDLSSFRSAAGLPAKAPQLSLVTGSSSVTVPGDEVEADLDLEWSGATARNATIIYVYADQSLAQGGVIGAFDFAIQNQIAPIISISYGACEIANSPSFFSFLQADAIQAKAQGQTIVSAVGDVGATDCESPNATISTSGLAVDLPAALQNVTGVGGTTFMGDDNHNPTFWNANNDAGGGSAIKYIPETTWNDSALAGTLSSTGGGVSSLVAKPAFQTALTPADGHRDVPDLALSASPNHDPYLVCDADEENSPGPAGLCSNGFRDANNNLFPVGGTSADAPQFAGLVALINQATQNSAGSSNVNTILYNLAGTPATYALAFHDITSGNNKQTCLGGSTGCVSANSHVAIAGNRSHVPAYTALFLLPLGAVFVSVGRRRWMTGLAMLVVVAAFSFQIACGGGSSSSTPPPVTPPNLSIGWSAGAGYDLVTGLGSVDASALANAWPGFTGSPAFDLSASPSSVTTTTTAPGHTTVTLTRDSSTFSGNVAVTCVATGDATGDALATCSLNPTAATLNSGAQTATTVLTVSATHAGTYLVSVTGVSGSISHAVSVPVTVN
jgi:hypothetical protein